MADKYNPNLPQLVGIEWAPIRDENLVFTSAFNEREVGYGFTLPGDTQIGQARYYINNTKSGVRRVYLANIYNRGDIGKSGPVQRTIIPVNSGSTTGSDISLVVISGSATVASCLAQPNGAGLIIISPVTYPNTNNYFDAYFAADDYPFLDGKRILQVNILFSGAGYNAITSGPLVPLSPPDYTPLLFGVVKRKSDGTQLGNVDFKDFMDLSGNRDKIVRRVGLGETFALWSGGASSDGTTMPWTYADLQRFESTHGDRVVVECRAQFDTDGDKIQVYYMAMEVLYCEETRVASGGRIWYPLYGMNYTPIRSLPSRTADPVLPAGDYILTLSVGNNIIAQALDKGDTNLSDLNALRQYRSVETIPAVQVNVAQEEGEEFSVESTDIIPQLSLALTGLDPVDAVHGYGRLAVAQVYGTRTAEQGVFDLGVPANTSYHWIRFYARRWGDTSSPLVAYRSVTPTQRASITPSEFDALPEITDGWREVTLRFEVPTVLAGGGVERRYTFESLGETASNRWEVLGMTAPAISGVPGDLFNQVPSTQRLGTTTYEGISASSRWAPGYAPPASGGPSLDFTTDLVLLLSQDPPSISGFGVSETTQAITGIGLDCGIDPCCIPTGITYNQISWDSVGPAYMDTFGREVSDGWGTADTGDAWSVSGGSTSDYNVDGSRGLILDGGARSALLGSLLNPNVTVEVTPPQVATGASYFVGVIGRRIDASNFYFLRLGFDTSGNVDLDIVKVFGGSGSVIASAANVITYKPGETMKVRFQIDGSTLSGKTWLAGNSEPAAFDVSTTDTDIATAGAVGVLTDLDLGNTNTNLIIGFDNFIAADADDTFWPVLGYYELQRKDTIDVEYKTIMKHSQPVATSFKDYEARVGIESTYRMRVVNSSDFPGPWSSEVSTTLTSPGITGGDCVADGHILIFTSNEKQDGSINLAYASVWEDKVSEDFTFAEAGFVQLQGMYGRDYHVAFRPLERGGEQFSRTVLVQAAAIAPETLDGFTSLRDMAWDDVSYICVRDEDGNRWLASVLVPQGRVLRNRKLYMANVTVIETTDTPSPVDPWS